MKYFSHLNTATEVIQQYHGREPLHHFLKNFFSRHSKYGSKDRKRISHLCYVFYRLVNSVVPGEFVHHPELIRTIILCGLFLCGEEPDELLMVVKPELNARISSSIAEKVSIINTDGGFSRIDLEKLFPALDELSPEINQNSFNISHLQQPDLFIRIRPGFQRVVVKKLEENGQHYSLIGDSVVRLPNRANIDKLFEIDKEVVIQDLSSQEIGQFLQPISDLHKTISVWDCCAASGGKSLLAKDIIGNIDLTVSDVRESILVNLKKRFAKAGINQYKSYVADLSVPALYTRTISRTQDVQAAVSGSPFDLIIADVPCTGSGTWGRTPEQLYYFDRSSIEKYARLQQQILLNVLPKLKPSGKLLYSTCSVFKKENQDVIEFILQQFPLKVERMEMLKGYEKGADTMFAALLG